MNSFKSWRPVDVGDKPVEEPLGLHVLLPPSPFPASQEGLLKHRLQVMDLGHQGWLIDLLVILSGTQTWPWNNLHL